MYTYSFVYGNQDTELWKRRLLELQVMLRTIVASESAAW